MLKTIVLVTHVLIAIGIVALILLQRGKGAEAGAAFGAGASGTVFGSRGSANFLSRSTAVLATLFFASSLGLAFLSGQREAPESIMEQVAPAREDAGGLPAIEGREFEADEGLPTLPDVGTEAEETGNGEGTPQSD
jgi:preprotein translocase subunit SecG